MSTLEETVFVTTSRTAYPYAMVHTAECPSAKRSKYGREGTFDEVAANQAIGYSGRPDFHDGCIKPESDLRLALLRRTAAFRNKRLATERRQRAMNELGVVRAAMDNLISEVGAMTAEEEAEVSATAEAAKTGRWYPSHRALRDIANAG